MARRYLQIHGGVGYTRDYGAEKLLRDALVTPIYEGTSQIQALMAMKDKLQHVMRNPQDFVKRVAKHVGAASRRAIHSNDAWHACAACRWPPYSTCSPAQPLTKSRASAKSRSPRGPRHLPKTRTPSAISPLRCCTPSV